MTNTICKLWGAILLIAAFSLSITNQANAQTSACLTPPSCEELGYVFSSAECGSISLRCPFDTTRYFCTFSSKIADILYSDLTTSPTIIVGKTPIGVVFNMDKRLAIGLNYEMKINSNTKDAIVDGLGLVDGRKNTDLILAYAKSHSGVTMPAAEYCNNYSTPGTKAGDWYLMSASEHSLLSKQWEIVKSTMEKVGGNISQITSQPTLYQTSTQVGNTHIVLVNDIEIKVPFVEDGLPTFPIIKF